MLNRRADKLELIRIAEAVALEKSIDKELIIGSMANGIAKAAKSKFGSENEIKVEIDRESGDIGIYRKLVIVENPENSNLSALLFNIFNCPKKKWAEAHFEISIMWVKYIYFFLIFNFIYLLNTFELSVFSHENEPSLSGILPKCP